MVHESPVKAAAAKPRSSRRLRGSRACDCCHIRKVRCDIDLNGPGKPCTNCRLDGQACVSYRGSKARPNSTHTTSKAEAVPKPPESNGYVPAKTTVSQDLPVINSLGRAPEKRLIPKQRAPTNLTANIDLRIADLWMQSNSGTATPATRQVPFVHSQKRLGESDIPRLRFGELSCSRGLDDHVTFSYYQFLSLKSLSKVQPDDVRYLEFIGSLHIPLRPVLDAFVREYFLHVHPVLPIVDERNFWAMYEDSMMDTDMPGRLSLFVLQAMLFAACATVSLEVLRCCGFSSVRQARETFYRRAKTLFDLSRETDYYSVAQGALLLTYYTTNTDPNVNSHWLSIAVQNARVINAQLYHRDRLISNPERLKKKRLWWCCILRDRVMPLGCRRPTLITHEHFDFSETFREEDLEHEIGFSQVYDAETQRQLMKTIIGQCDLAVILTDVLATCYPLDGSHCLARFAPPDLESTRKRIQENRSRLLDWFTAFSLQNVPSTDTNACHVSVTLYTNLLYIYYHSARLALCQYEILITESCVEHNMEGKTVQSLNYAKSEMRSATGAITEIVKTLIWLKAAQYLPVSAVAYTALPLVLTALDLKMSSDPAEATTRRRQLEVYVEAMRLYRKRYDGTEQLSSVVERLLSDAEPEARRICSANSGSSTPERRLVLSRRSKDWSDILNQRPKFYLRLTLALDMALARGKFPEETDFPRSCRMVEIGGEESFVSDKTIGRDYIDITMPCLQPSGPLSNSSSRVDLQEMFDIGGGGGNSQVNLDFADLFGEHDQQLGTYEGPHGYLDEVQTLFDLNVAF